MKSYGLGKEFRTLLYFYLIYFVSRCVEIIYDNAVTHICVRISKCNWIHSLWSWNRICQLWVYE